MLDVLGAPVHVGYMEAGPDFVGRCGIGGGGVLEESDGLGVATGGGGDETGTLEEEAAFADGCGLDEGAFGFGRGVTGPSDGEPLEEGKFGFLGWGIADGGAEGGDGFEGAVERVADGDIHP